MMDSFIYLFSGLRWQDILDIALNSYILFRFYVLFRGTHVIRVLLAICALWAAGQAAVFLGLIITNWAMQGVITLAAFTIIIVFRNEISSVLQTRDLKSFLWGIPRYQFHTPLNIIVDSVYEMAEKKIGALIVLPMKQGLYSVVQGGVPLNGELSREMLVSVFWPDNPVHDGAAVIQGNLITRMGVILPLSKSEDLPSFFGTRHRAALGLAELTDALVIVVSEERGKVSVFKENQIYDINHRLNLEKILQAHAGDESAKKGLRHETIKLLTAAMICLFSVTGLWLSFSKGMETLATHEVPVEFMNPDQKMEIISSSASSVKLQISGARPLINSIKPEQMNIKLNLSEAVVGPNRLSIAKENILLPPGIRLKQADPAEIEVTLDKLVEKELPIQPNWTGKLPEGLVLKAAKTIPQTIRVVGRGIALKDISTIFTDPVQLDTLTKSGVLTIGLAFDAVSSRLDHDNKIQIQYHIGSKSTL